MSITKLSEIKVDKNKLIANFKDIKNIGNFKMLSCIKLLFSKENILKNSSNYMQIILFIFSIISILIFSCYDRIKIKEFIKDINNGIIPKIINKNIESKNTS